MSKSPSIVGANPENGRSKSDFYPTPPDVTQALLDFLKLPPQTYIWEPACGELDMSKVLEQNDMRVISTDINGPYGGLDFLRTSTNALEYDWIITNPPFTLADKFIEHASGSGKPFAFLLKCQYWHAASRFDLFEKYTPTYICPLTWRPDFSFKDKSEKHHPLMDVMWCIWTKQYGPKRAATYIPLNKERDNEHD